MENINREYLPSRNAKYIQNVSDIQQWIERNFSKYKCLSRIGHTVMPDDSGNERDNINNALWSFSEDVKLRSLIVKCVRKMAILDVTEDMQFPYLTWKGKKEFYEYHGIMKSKV
jgi:hypothetical protein